MSNQVLVSNLPCTDPSPCSLVTRGMSYPREERRVNKTSETERKQREMRREPDSQREAAHQPNMHRHPLLFGFPSHLGHHRALRRVPRAMQQALIRYLSHVCDSTRSLAVSNSLTPHGLQPAVSSGHGISQARILGYVPFPPPGDLPDPGIKSTSPAAHALAGRFFTTELPRKPICFIHSINNVYVSIPTSKFLPPSPLGIYIFALYFQVSILALQINSSIPFSQITHIYSICALIYSLCFSFSDFTLIGLLYIRN